ncbi:phage prohead protease, HK97 family [Limosilactobacillus vaginalis DSM 5837 = ATCC 49540]|uniref:Phage prohead protease, HK97 family n=2 Tax=Limosilactobacillus vaginalis TaxID=1633 RepID=C2ERM2_9LACO|nr:phage prohead protease, HK97 family [Limosilactobacillus vaginalis DSM 5837 = ATCC 49540]
MQMTTKTTNRDVRTFTANHLAIRRDVESGTRQLSGYAVAFNQPSQPLPFTEYISPHAFDNVDFSQVRLLYAHDFNNILARVDSGTLSLKTDDKGLFFIADIPNTTLGNDVYTNVENGNIKGLSFNAQIDPNNGDTWEQGAGGVVIHTINHFASLAEISLTPIPAYTETSVQVARDYKEVLNNMKTDSSAAAQSQAPASSSAASAEPSSASSADSAKQIATLINKVNELLNSAQPANSTAKRDDSVEEADSDEVDRASAPANPGDPTSSAKSASTAVANPGDPTSNKNASRAAEPASDVTRSAEPVVAVNENKENNENGDDIQMSTKLNDPKESITRDFANFLKTGQVADSISRDGSNIGLSAGSVIIPETILTPEHEQHQFPRLGSLVRTVKVSTTTGKLPVFQTSSDKLSVHAEFQPSERHAAPEIKPINWDLNTYTGNYAFSQDLISDSSYDWQSELSSRLQELKDNTNDDLIINALTNGVTTKTATDLISDIKTALNVNLKPQDSQAASIVLSQSAFNELDQMTDKEGRPLVQPDVTKGTGQSILGKTVVVVDDLLFPKAKAGDANIVIAPLQKAVINFQNNEITGQFIDSYDVWYKILGIYLREDVVQARKDLITLITSSKATAGAASGLPAK